MRWLLDDGGLDWDCSARLGLVLIAFCSNGCYEFSVIRINQAIFVPIRCVIPLPL